MPKVFISVYPFGEIDTTPIQLLEKANIHYSKNNTRKELKPEETAKFASDCDGIIAGTENLTPLVQKSNRLRSISRVGVGLDSVPLDLCKEKNIDVSYTPDAVTPAVVELTVGIMITLTRFVHEANCNIKGGNWERFIGKRIGESVIGIIGAGRVGGGVIRILTAFQPKQILFNDIFDKSDIIRRNQTFSSEGEREVEIRQTTKQEIYATADIISLHTPLTHDTKDMINEKTLSYFKKESFLINQARGALIEEEALYRCLKEKRIQGAALDVFKEEPYKGKLATLDNILLTSHMGSCSLDCRIRMETEAAENIIRALC